MAASDSKTTAESLIPLFHFQQLLNQGQNGRRISLLGSIRSRPALITLERAAFPTEPSIIKIFLTGITNTTNLGANDIYHWYMANHQPSSDASAGSPPDLKLNLIYPCTDQHIKKYSPQAVRMVTETPEIYSHHVQPYMRQKREEGRLNWVFNIIEGRTEQEDVILRDHSGSEEGFLLLPDLNWDRKTMGSLHLLALVEKRDIWSLRDLKKRHVSWLRGMRERILQAAVRIYGTHGVEHDMLKLYVHCESQIKTTYPPTYLVKPLLPESATNPLTFILLLPTDQPTYYHFHVHVVHVALEAGATQATGKAFGLENIISQLETLQGGDDAGMADVSLTYFLGEASELWERVFGPLKERGGVMGGEQE
jgi:m7GpppX diphosphatase